MPTGKYIRKPFFNENQSKDIIHKYVELKMGAQEIGDSIGFSKRAIQTCLRKNNIKSRTNAEVHRHFTLNENFLDSIDTPEKAYFLGWIFTDGCVAKDNTTIRINLHHQDKLVLERLNSIIGSNKPLKLLDYTDKLVELPNQEMGYRKNQYALIIHSGRLWRRIQELGCPPAKSKILQYPTWVTKELFPFFLRGVLEGDGYIFKKRPCMGITGNYEFLDGILKDIYKYTNIKCKIYPHGKYSSCLRLDRQKDCLTLLDFIYKDRKDLILERKYLLYIQHKKNFPPKK